MAIRLSLDHFQRKQNNTALADHIYKVISECPGIESLPVNDGNLLFIYKKGGYEITFMGMVEEDEMVQFRTVNMLTVNKSRYQDKIFRILAEMNLKYKIVKFAYDKDDSEIVAYIDFPINGADLTSKQIRRAVSVIKSVIMPGYKRCKAVLDTGTDPGMEEVSTVSREDIVELLKIMIDKDKKEEETQAPTVKKGLDVLFDDNSL
jgi:hypothetical protein